MPKSKANARLAASPMAKDNRFVTAHQKQTHKRKRDDKSEKPLLKPNTDEKQFKVICLDESSQQFDMPVKKIKQDNQIVEAALNKESPTFKPKSNSISPIVKQQKEQITIGDHELKVVQINHFFKLNSEIYVEVMLGNSQGKIHREPQLKTYRSLQKNLHTKMLLYSYMVNYLIETGKPYNHQRQQ